MNERTTNLIIELAEWNGRLSAVIDIALLDLKYEHAETATVRLRTILTEYEAYRDAAHAKLISGIQQPVV